MKLTKLLLLIFTVLGCWHTAKCQQRPAKPKISKTQKRLVRQIAKYGKFESQNIYRSASFSEQYARFDSLKRISSTDEILLFTTHRSPTVRAYAFVALLNSQKFEQALARLQSACNDTSVFELQNGCIGSAMTVSCFMSARLRIAVKRAGYVFTAQQQQVIEEINEKLPDYFLEQKIVARQLEHNK